jgi:aryl-alcohol dehydrogenase-like predicted oxidoreductase
VDTGPTVLSRKWIDEASGDAPTRVALAWLSITASIASATNLGQLTDLIEATKLELDRPAVEWLDRASAWA